MEVTTLVIVGNILAVYGLFDFLMCGDRKLRMYASLYMVMGGIIIELAKYLQCTYTRP